MDYIKKQKIDNFMKFMGYEYGSVQDGSGESINYIKYLNDNPDASILVTIRDCKAISKDPNWISAKPFSIIGFNIQISRPNDTDFTVMIDDFDRFHKMTLPIMNAVLKLTQED